MAMINSINFGNDTHSFTLPYGVCSTAADTASKTVTVDNFSLETGAVVIVKFTYANSIASPTLNVNGTGAKSIMRYGTTATSTGTTTTGWVAGAVQMFTYDGTNWIRDYWNNTTYSNASLGQGYATCSTAAATVAKTASLSSYALTTGGIVSVKFTNAVPASATLNINSKGAKSIYYRGAAITANVIKAGDIATFIYSSQYHLIAIDRWQQDIDSKQATITGAATTITSSNLTASRALVSDSSGKVAVSAVTSTELGYLDGVTSAIQTQLDGKAASSHNHAASNITSGTLDAARLPSASSSAAGIVSTGSQTFAGAKTFSSKITASGGITTGGSIVSDTAVTDDIGSAAIPFEAVYAKEISLYGSSSVNNAGYLKIDTEGTSSTKGSTTLRLGNTSSEGEDCNAEGYLEICSEDGHVARFETNPYMESNLYYTLPETGGTFATTSDISDYAMPIAGGTFTGKATAYSTNRTGANLRNIIVVDSTGNTSQSTDRIYMYRK